MDPTRVIDLFAGPGGLGEGFSAAGHSGSFRVALSIEMEKTAHATLTLRSFFRLFGEDAPDEYYRYVRGEIGIDELAAAHPREWACAGTEAWEAELGGTSFDHLQVRERVDAALGPDAVGGDTVVLGGPPCQAYSLVGRSRMLRVRGAEFESDRRHVLYREYLKILADHAPAVFVLENVKGLLSSRHKGERIFERILEDLHRPGSALPDFDARETSVEYNLYALQPQEQGQLFSSGYTAPEQFIVRAEQLGLPQARHRVIVLGVRSDLGARAHAAIRSLERSSAAPATVDSAIDTLPRLRSGLSSGPDTDARWVDVVRLSAARLLSSTRVVSGELAESIERVRGAVSAPEAGRGGRWVRGETQPRLRPDWFFDPKLGGALNHQTRGLTVRRDDPERPERSSPLKLLLGRCVLQHHRLEDDEWSPYGFFGGPAAAGEHRPLPLADEELIGDFEARFDLARGNEPGLSLVVPFPVAKLSRHDLVQKTIEHFAYPILSGDLEVDLGDEDGSVKLNSDSLIAAASEAFSEPGWDEVFQFLLDCATGPDPEELPPIPAADNPQLHPIGDRLEAIGVESLRAKLDAGELVRLRVPLHVKYQKTSKQPAKTEPAYFDLFMRSDPDGVAARREYYVRGGLTISGIKTDVGSYPVNGFLHVGDGALSELLGDSEEVSHNDWRPYSLEAENKVKFELGPTTIRYVKGALEAAAKAIFADDSGKVEGALLDFFGIDDPERGGSQTKGGVLPKPKPKAKDKTKEPPEPPAPRRPRPFLVSTPKPGQVQITRNKESTDIEPTIRVRLAYSLEGGSSITKHSRFDFDVTAASSPITANGDRLTGISRTATNEFLLSVDPDDPDFRFVAGGFDAHRDLVVDVRYQG